MVSKHTPGPWRSEYDDNGFHYIAADGMPSPYIVATGGEGDIDQANARLIAAAPEMLEALKRAETHFRVLPQSMDEPGSVMDQMKKAIAKAEGRQ